MKTKEFLPAASLAEKEDKKSSGDAGKLNSSINVANTEKTSTEPRQRKKKSE